MGGVRTSGGEENPSFSEDEHRRIISEFLDYAPGGNADVVRRIHLLRNDAREDQKITVTYYAGNECVRVGAPTPFPARRTPLGPLVDLIAGRIAGAIGAGALAHEIAEAIVRDMKDGFPMTTAPSDARILIKVRSRKTGVAFWELVNNIGAHEGAMIWFNFGRGIMNGDEWEFLSWLPAMPITDEG